MSWSERFVQGHRRQTDCAIHRVYAELASDPLVLQSFQELLCIVRKQAPRLFDAPIVNGRHLAVDALVNLSWFRDMHLRPASDWAGTTSSWRPAVSSLAYHLIGLYKVPSFLASCWYATDPAAERKRNWFVQHSRGASFRSLHLPVVMTRKMEHIFLASHDHLPIEYAIRKAELLALGATPACVKAVMSTRLATDLRHSEFWRTVWIFLIVNARDVDPAQIGPMIDYIQAVRHDRIRGEALDGAVEFGPPQPEFSMKGRTVQSMLRLMQVWHRTVGSSSDSWSWARSPFQPLLYEEARTSAEEEPRRWHMMELTSSAQLRRESAALHHCVASYANRCYSGSSSIWSLRMWRGEKIHHVLTVEVDPKKRAVVQARGRLNHAASGKSLRLLQDWAGREKLQMSL